MVIQLYRPYTGDDQNPWVVRRSMHQLKDSWNRVGVQTFFLQSSENRLVGGIFRGSTSNQMGCPSFNPRKISAISWLTPFFWRSATPPPRERPVVLAMAHTHTFFFLAKCGDPLGTKVSFWVLWSFAVWFWDWDVFGHDLTTNRRLPMRTVTNRRRSFFVIHTCNLGYQIEQAKLQLPAPVSKRARLCCNFRRAASCLLRPDWQCSNPSCSIYSMF